MGISCIILAGGKSKRLRDKAFTMLHKNPLIYYVYQAVKPFFREIIVVVKTERQRKKLEKILPVKIIKDYSRIYSPIAAIKAGCAVVVSEYVFVIACDMPFVDGVTIFRLLSRMKKGIDAIAYAKKKYYEPLCAVYKKTIFDNVSVDQSLQNVIAAVRKKALIPIKDSKPFFNLNTKKDLIRAEKLMG